MPRSGIAVWSVISDIITVIVLGCHEPHPYKVVNLISCWNDNSAFGILHKFSW